MSTAAEMALREAEDREGILLEQQQQRAPRVYELEIGEHSTSSRLSELQLEHLEIRAQHLEELHRGRLKEWARDLAAYEFGSSRLNPGSPPIASREIAELRARVELERGRRAAQHSTEESST